SLAAGSWQLGPTASCKLPAASSSRHQRWTDRFDGAVEPPRVRPDARRRQRRRVVEGARQIRHLLGADGVDPGEEVVEREQRYVVEDRARAAGHPRPGRLEPENDPALDVLLRAVELLAFDPLVAEPRQLATDDLAGLADVVGAGADVHRDRAVGD